MGSYRETVWKNGVTPLNASNMNNIETGIQENRDRDAYLKYLIDTLTVNIPDWVINGSKPSWATVSGIGVDTYVAGVMSSHNHSASAHDGFLAPKVHTHTISQITNFPDASSLGNNFALVTHNSQWEASQLAEVAFSGNYSDLNGKPTKVSEFTNDVGYITIEDIHHTMEGVWHGGDITQELVCLCGFQPSEITIVEKNAGNVTTNVYHYTENTYIGDSYLVFTGNGFNIKSVSNGIWNRESYSYSWEAVSEGLSGLPDISVQDNGKVLTADNGAWVAEHLPIATRSVQGVVAVGDGLDIEQGTLALKQSYDDYLSEVTYNKPRITLFNLYNGNTQISAGKHELGTTLVIDNIRHTETFVDNVSGSLTVSIGSTVIGSTTASSTEARFDFATQTLSPVTESSVVCSISGTDTKGNSISANISLSFQNSVYWGVGGATITTSSAVRELGNSAISNTAQRTITVNSTNDNYIWYVYPSRLGMVTFTVGGFEGGFNEPEEMSVTNASGYTETFYAYRSVNNNLGNTTVVIALA